MAAAAIDLASPAMEVVLKVPDPKRLVCKGSERVGRQLGLRGFELIPSFRAFVEATIKHHLLNESNQILTHPRSCLPALHV